MDILSEGIVFMAMNSLELTLKTLTPLWTGGADGKADRLHITGLMGSLRWWYEVMIRSIGGHVCDPSKHSCQYDPSKPDTGLCDVCKVFGATGWARRFRLIIPQDNLQPKKPIASRSDGSGRLVLTLSGNHPDNRGLGHKWYLTGNPLSGQIKLGIIPTGPIDKDGNELFDPAIIAAVFQFIADRASIGAKPQMGLGVIQVANRQSTQPLIKHLEQIISTHQTRHDLKTRVDDELPCLQNMFFASVNVSSTLESATFDLKYDLRNMLREEFKGDRLRHTIMGFVRGGNRIGAKIMMSFPYDDGTVRLWGWIPRLTQSKPSRDEILNEIYYFLEDVYGPDQTSFWLDFNPEQNRNVLEYLDKNLLAGVE
jgi:CRISPR-associated protein Cmr1